jgi:hypothetical protein
MLLRLLATGLDVGSRGAEILAFEAVLGVFGLPVVRC